MGRLVASLGAAFIVASTTLVASAQSTDAVAATELFKQGRDAMAKGDHALACQKFADSARLDLKVGTLLNLAECQEKLGKIAAARHDLQRAIDVAKANGDDRLELAQSRLAAIDKKVPRLTVLLAPSASEAKPRVQRDGIDMGSGSLGSPLPVEPGEHVVTVSAPSHEDRTFKATLSEGEQKTLTVDVGPAGSSTTAATKTEPPSESTGSTTSTLRTVGWITAGAGVASLGVGTVFGLIAMNLNEKSNERCDANNRCFPDGKADRTDAQSAGNVATAFFIIGGVAVAAGVVLVLTSPTSNNKKTATIAPWVSPQGTGLSFRGGF